jgi:serine/threonine protein kinase/MFS family permease
MTRRIYCSSCSSEIRDGSNICPNCGLRWDDVSTRLDSNRAGKSSTSRYTSFDSIDNARFVPGAMLAGRYRIVGLLGRGGMGEVYRADDLKLGQTVALKFLPDHLHRDSAALGRFHTEVRIARQVSHPNVCRVYDIGEVDGRHYISMEFIKGEELSSLLRRIGRLPPDKATEIARQLCAGLAATHKIGVLHRDLKPANVMIDENGNVRLTDFGIAGLVEEIGNEDVRAGTPAYMSPEQLAGDELTVKSDIYSLGLVLYEVFTGKKAFEAPTLTELIDLRNSTTPPSPSALVKEINPLVERLILRCLEKDADRRPASALQVAASLPGGDPVAAALAAGETPTPEMVAASTKEVGLKPVVAVAYLGAIIVGLFFTVLVSTKATLISQITMGKSPDSLRDRAREVLRGVGYTDPPTDTADGFRLHRDYWRYIKETDSSPTRWDRLRNSQPPAIHYWYRQSPRYLVPVFAESTTRVSRSDPPPLVSGMVGIELDPEGRLWSFKAVPPQIDTEVESPKANAQSQLTEIPNSQSASQPDWSGMFAAAGLDLANFTSTDPNWVPPVSNDARAAWTGAYPAQPQLRIRIEAASFEAKPVYFEIIGPWSRPGQMKEAPVSKGERIINILLLALFFLVIVASILLARYNLRHGRGDRRGATRLAVFVFSAFMLSWVLRASHVPTADEFKLWIQYAQFAVLVSIIFWLFYISLEPYVRRWWPHRIISWSRLLAGGWRDPLVGRDLLIGGVVGVWLALFYSLQAVVPRWLNITPEAPAIPDLENLLGMRMVAGNFLFNHLTYVIFLSLTVLFVLLLLRIVLRKDWAAIGVCALFVAIFSIDQSGNLPIQFISGGLATAIILFVLVRFGLLALTACFLFLFLLQQYPISSDFSVWYIEATIFALGLAVCLAIYGFYISLAGQPLFGAKLLED